MALDPGRSTASTLTVTGRVRTGGTMCRPGGSERCVVSTTWANDRPYPRTVGVAVPFEVETEDGQRYLIEPREAAVRLAVRRRESGEAAGTDGIGARHVVRETGWLGPGEDVVVEGEIDPKAKPRSPAPRLLARRITGPGSGAVSTALPLASPHCIPPRLLTVGAIEPESVVATPVSAPVAAPTPGRERTPPPVLVAPPDEATPSPDADLPALGRTARPRRPRGKPTIDS